MSKYAEAYQTTEAAQTACKGSSSLPWPRVLFPEIQAFFESEEGQREFAEWKAQQGKSKG